MASTDARPIPQKNVAYRVTFPIFDADGDLVTGATGLDSEVSKDGGAFTDCTNEATEIATASGIYYLDLTNTEMNADTVAVIIKTSSSGAKTTPIVMYPEEAGDIRVNATQWNSLTTVALPLTPTTAGRTLDVSAGGEAGLDWANIGSPTTAVNLSATNIDVDQVVASVSGAVGSVTGLTAANLDVAVSSRMATYTQPTGFLAATFPGGTIANTTNITAGTITTTTNLTNLPAITANWLTAAGTAADFTTEIQTGLATAANLSTLQTTANDILTDTAEIGVAGAGLTNINLPNQTMDIIGNITGNLSGSVGSVTGLTASDVGAIKAKTDSLTFTVAGQVDANAESMNATEILGNGTSGDLWRG